ncbi:hypothetical protein P343_15705 [Sporolactobacillus laevolacticus DSM 442]|uniref:Uncharacterized protein n=1 Tax=Sporolactobacillus laevolacticus DSM 442 TaxID=1395513 RepID=V6IW18_9BACL|nr:hypothetical protein P343_15705 [Sporolactobacillus laevolacticus DSM 442]
MRATAENPEIFCFLFYQSFPKTLDLFNEIAQHGIEQG